MSETIEVAKLEQFILQETDGLDKENVSVWAAMQNKKLSDDEYEALNDKYYANIGRILNARKVLEWIDKNKTRAIRTEECSYG